MGLFDALPAAAASKRPAEEEPGAQQRAKASRTALDPATAAAVPPPPAEPSAADLEALEEDDDAADPAGAAASAEDAYQQQPQQQAGAADDDDDVPPPPPPPPPAADPQQQQQQAGQQQQGPDQVSAALRKIAGHIGHPKKFGKASALLRELLAQGAVRAHHGPLLFSALKAAMAQPAQAAEPLLAREYSKLFTAASKASEVFTTKEKAQLDVYGTWAVLRNQLAATDDSFAFNKVVSQVKAMVGGLPPVIDEDEDEALLAGLAVAAAAPDPVLAAYDQRGQQQGQAQAEQGEAEQQQQQAETAVAADAEADPFGLDALLEQQAAAEAAAAEARRRREAAAAAGRAQGPVKSQTWSAAEVVVQRRAALLDCLHAAKACYKNAWARVSVDLLAEHFDTHADRFTPSQRASVRELMAFVRDQRRLRKLGPSAKEVNRDTTTFDRARAEWSTATVSHRGKVGAKGDRGAEQWLGG